MLLTGTDERGRSQPVLTSQRYGRGKALALTLQDTWQWQMHASISLEDQTHENFWRQMMRWLVDGVPEVVEARTTVDRVEPGEPCDDRGDDRGQALRRAERRRRHRTRHAARWHDVDVPLEWTGERDGLYRGTFVSNNGGGAPTKWRSTRPVASDIIGSGVTLPARGSERRGVFRPDDARSAAAPDCRRNGRPVLYDGNGAGLAEDVRYGGRGVTSVEERELWNMPVILFALMGLCARNGATAGSWGCPDASRRFS